MSTTAIELYFPGGTLAQYDDVLQRMGLVHGGDTGANGIFHWVAEVDGGIKVVDVWPSIEAFNTFAQEQIIPFSQAAGLPEPELTFHEVYNTLSGV